MKIFKFILLVFPLVLLQCSKSSDDNDNTPVNDPVNISISDLSVDEGQAYQNISIQLRLDMASDQQITANISTNDGTAEAGKDYNAVTNQPVVFAAGETEQSYEITIAGDLILEEDEYFEVSIVNVTGSATIDDGTARVDLLNDDQMGTQPIPVALTIDWPALLSLPPGSEAPYEIMNFGQPSNIPNAEFTSVTALNDTISFEPRFSPLGDTILYYEVTFDAGIDPDDYFEDLSDWTDTVGVDAKLLIIDNAVNDLEFKYNLWFYIGKLTGERVGPFLIDPKIRIQGQ